MRNDAQRLKSQECLYIAARAAMAVGIGWSYLAVAITLNLGGLARILRDEPWGPVLVAEIFVVVGVMFGVTGARIGAENLGLVPVRATRRR
jgi:hypothetical protein